jgi:hypothetical protein
MKKNTLLFLGVLPILSFYQQATAMQEPAQHPDGLLAANAYASGAIDFFKIVYSKQPSQKPTVEQLEDLREFLTNRIKNADKILQHLISDEIEQRVLNPDWILKYGGDPENDLNVRVIYHFSSMVQKNLAFGILNMKSSGDLRDVEKELEQFEKLDLGQLELIESKVFAQALLKHMQMILAPCDEQKS